MTAFGASFGSGLAVASSNYNANKDTEVASPPSDSISSLSFSPAANYLIATSWDNQVRCYEVQANGQSAGKAAISHDQPVLCSDWSADGSTVFTGGCDNVAKMWNLQTNQTQVVAKHDAPIRHLFSVKEMNNMLVTGSWDKTIRYWDLRQPNPVHTQQLPERVYAMDVTHPLLVVGMANRRIQVFNMSNPQTVYKDLESPLKFQTRCVTCFPDSTGYLVGSIEGRVAVHHVEDNMQSKNFTFKCHRDGNDIYAVNSIAFHPQYGTFVTAGSDGAFNFWDKDSKQRLKAMLKCSQPIPCSTFNRDGTIYAYAVSYDWSRGYAEYNPSNAQHHILLHKPQDIEVKNRARTGRR
ncbi:WD40 repeat-like protein [Coccomyxa subellipsoidea C-169]|uniref:WD40 repeat-like protein n=1 Tax=Coccomyxa subellipsoidea (strain C-169) TaxID=574566 RepID=I0YV79_COCSC|nr:WD40 repeat-like protein [Coccomyxa subellipsoidea C-169]EIE22298.1 WD40 repeat-like protein [Coccomyxa subellipsoidea C-169]|eukprot:XP_005646842.1 WD40 repeat-like protein [Coccomyxa subellipsoidea C-169]